MSKIEVDAITEQSGSTLTVGGGASKTVVADATTVTLGRCGGTVALASGATQTGFGRTGTVDWDTTPKTATFTAVSGDGFFANTTNGAFTMNLPAGVAGAIVSVADYAGTWGTNALTVSPNGTDKIGSVNVDVVLNTEGQSVTFIFVDSTQGWINTMDSTSNERGDQFISATGGTITTSGDFKFHTFTGPGTFCVSAGGGPVSKTDYLVVAGGGSGGQNHGGAGGAGGYRESSGTSSGGYSASPLGACVSALPITAQAYPITVGSGGASGPGVGNTGSNSIFSTITSAGGGGGGGFGPDGANGGNGGGGGGGSPGTSPLGGGNKGTGNTPPVSPPQGNPGGNGSSGPDAGNGGGGGGATVAGGDSSGTSINAGVSGAGGNGATSSINGTPTVRAGGGSGGRWGSGSVGSAGTGGGGTGGTIPPAPAATAGTANTGGGGGGGADGNGVGGAGGSGLVIIRYKFQ
jgi:hypothetical protein